jgi:hypothetical protein
MSRMVRVVQLLEDQLLVDQLQAVQLLEDQLQSDQRE